MKPFFLSDSFSWNTNNSNVYWLKKTNLYNSNLSVKQNIGLLLILNLVLLKLRLSGHFSNIKYMHKNEDLK